MLKNVYCCDSCNVKIPFNRARVQFQVCDDYFSCSDCEVLGLVSGTHNIEHDYDVYKGESKMFSKSPGKHEAGK